MADAGIVAIATYVPAGRIAAGVARAHGAGLPPGAKSVAVPDVDEDVVTMAVEAAGDALRAAGGAVVDVDALTMVTCSSPYAEHGAGIEVARGLGIRRSARVIELAGDVKGVAGAIRVAADAVAMGRGDLQLVIAADRRRGRTATSTEVLGAAAAAAVVGRGGAQVGAMRSCRHGVPTRWRPDGSVSVYTYDDPRYERDELLIPAVRHVIAGEPSFLALGASDARTGRAIAKAIGYANVELGDDDFAHIGDAGSAAALFALAHCKDDRDDATGALVALSPGSGADAIDIGPGRVAVSHRRPPQRDVDYVSYLRAHGVLLPPPPPEPIVPWTATPGAARADLQGALSAVCCRSCHALTIPAASRCVECRSADLEPADVPSVGTLVTYNVQHVVAVHPESSPLSVGVARFAGHEGSRGGQVSAMFVAGDADRLRVGAPVELAYRRLGSDDGLVRYGWKLRPVEAPDAR